MTTTQAPGCGTSSVSSHPEAAGRGAASRVCGYAAGLLFLPRSSPAAPNIPGNGVQTKP